MISNNQSILVIGGAGYIGSHIVLDLCDQGFDVTVFDNLSTGHKINIDSRANFIEGDILNPDDLHSVFQSLFTTVFHFAALKAAGESMLEPGKYATANITGTINILNQMVESGVKNIIFSSTAAVYGMPEYLPVDENHPLNPVNFYGFTKLEIERLLHWYSKLKGIRYASLRYFNAAGYDLQGRIIGLERNPANLLPIVMETAAGIGESMQIFGDDYDTPDGTGIRDYIHVSDLAQAHVLVFQELLNDGKPDIFNVGIGKGYSVLDVINSASKISGKNPKINYGSRRMGDPPRLVCDSSKIKSELGWKPMFGDIDQIIKTAWLWYLKDK